MFQLYQERTQFKKLQIEKDLFQVWRETSHEYI